MGCKVTKIPLAPNGQESLVFKQLQLNHGMQNAVLGHLNIHTRAFKEFLGTDWEKNPDLPILDENGEPKLVDKYAYNLSGDRMNVITQEIVSKDLIEDSVSPVDDRAVDNILTRWLQAAGIGTQFVKSIKDKDGNLVSAIAKADMLNGVIEILRGDTLSSEEKAEETSHFLIEMMGDNNPLLNKMMSDIDKYEIYKTVYQEYSGVEGENSDKIKREAVSRVIARLLVDPNAQFETVSDTSRANTWWDRVRTWLKSKFAGVDTGKILADIAPFVKAASIIRSGSVEGLQSIEEVKEFASKNETRSYYYHLSGEHISESDRLNEAFAQKILDKVAEGYKVNATGAYVRNRVSDLVKAHYRKIFHKENVDSDEAGIKALKGTYIHKLAEIIMNRITAGNSLDNREIMNEAFQDLQTDPEFSKQPLGFYTLSPGQIDALVKGVKYIHTQMQENQNRINQLTGTDGKATIHTELIIYDKNKDRGGTIDVAVVYSNGTVGIYDYKSIHMYTSGKKVQWDLPWYKSEAYSIQLFEYKRILASQYGVKNFSESRIIPIRVGLTTSKVNGLYALEMQHEQALKKEYLDPIPVADELTTDVSLNKTLEKMFSLRKTLQTKLSTNRQNVSLEERINKLDRAIKKLQLNMNVNYIIGEINSIYEEFLEREKIPSGEPDSLTHSDLADYREYMSVFEQFAVDAENAAKTTKNETIIQKLGQVGSTIQRITRKVHDKIADLALREESVDLEKPGKEVSTMGRLFKQLSNVNNPAFQFVFALANRNAENIRKDLNSKIDEIDIADKGLEEWARKNNKTKQEAFDVIYNKETGELIGKYSSSYYEEIKKAREESDHKWFLKRANIVASSTTDTKVDFDEEGRAKYEAYKKKTFDYYEKKNRGEHNREYLEKRKREFEEKFDVANHVSALYHKDNFIVRPAERVENFSKAFQSLTLPANKELLAYYEMYTRLNKEFSALTGKRIDDRFVAHIRQDMLDRIAQNGIASAGSLKQHILNSLEIRQSDSILGERDPATGNPINKVPFLYTDNLFQSLTDREIEAVRSEAMKELKEGSSASEFNDLYEKKLRQAEYRKGLKFKSRDLTSSMILFAEQALSYHYYSETEEAVRNIQEYTQNGGKTELTDGNGNKIKDPISSKMLIRLGIPSSEQEMLEKFVNRIWYGRSFTDKDMALLESKDEYDDKGILIKKGKKYSGIKAYRMLMQYISLKALGLKPILAASNAIGIKSNIYMMGAEGIYYNNPQIHQAHKAFLSRDLKYAAAVQYFELHSRNMTAKKALDRSASKLVTLLAADNWFVLHRMGDNMADNNVIVAMMHNYGVDSSGKIGRLEDIRKKEPAVKSFWETANFNEKGEFNIPGLSAQQELMFKNRANKVITAIKGTTTDIDRSLFDTTLVGMSLMKFRSWIPPLVQNRVGALSFDEVDGTFYAGRFNIALQELNRKEFVPKLKAFMELAGSSMGLYKMIPDQAVAERLFMEYLDQNPTMEGKVTLEEYIEFRKARLAGMAMELRILMSIFALVMASKAMIPDDDDDSTPFKKLIARNVYRTLNRGMLEISFFFSPTSVSQIIKSPVPAFTIFKDIKNLADNTADEWRDIINGENAPRDNTPAGYYTLKMIPGVSSAVDFFDIFDTYSENFNRY